MDDKKKKNLLITAVYCAVIFVIFYIITNLTAITVFFKSVLSVFSPIIIGAAGAYLLNPILKLFEYKVFKKLKSKPARRALSLILTYVTAVLLVIAFLWLMIPSVIQSIMDLTSKFDSYVDTTTSMIDGFIDKFAANIPAIENNVNSKTIIAALKDFFFASGDIFSTVMDYLAEFAMGLFVGVKNAILGLFISIYLLIDKERLHASVRKTTAALFGDKKRNTLLRYVRIINRTFGGFIVGKILDSLIIGLLTFVVLLIFRIPYAPLVSTIVGITNIIPIFGPIFGAIPSALIIFIASPQKAIIFLILILIIQQLDGNVIGPKILGESTGISSLGVIIAIIIMGEYFGVVGMIIGVPLFASITILISEIIERRLKAKGMPTSTDDYYPAYSLVDPHEHHETFGVKLVHKTAALFKKTVKIFSKKDKNKEKDTAEGGEEKNESEGEENNDDQ